jgi:hypothetical protein
MATRREMEARLSGIDGTIASGGDAGEAVELCRGLSYAEKWQAQVQERLAALI